MRNNLIFVKSEGNFESKRHLIEYFFDSVNRKWKRIERKGPIDLYWRLLPYGHIYDKDNLIEEFKILEKSYYYFKQKQREKKLERILNKDGRIF